MKSGAALLRCRVLESPQRRQFVEFDRDLSTPCVQGIPDCRGASRSIGGGHECQKEFGPKAAKWMRLTQTLLPAYSNHSAEMTALFDALLKRMDRCERPFRAHYRRNLTETFDFFHAAEVLSTAITKIM
jgi:hypothetical protein